MASSHKMGEALLLLLHHLLQPAQPQKNNGFAEATFHYVGATTYMVQYWISGSLPQMIRREQSERDMKQRTMKCRIEYRIFW